MVMDHATVDGTSGGLGNLGRRKLKARFSSWLRRFGREDWQKQTRRKAVQLREDVRAVWEDSRANYEWLRLKFKMNPPQDLRLHLGCGGVHKEGFVNIDHRTTRATDMVCDIRKLPFPDGSAAHIESYHVIEHVPHVEVQAMLREWNRVLKSGGSIVVECPDFDQAVREYLEGNEARIFNIFGLQRFKGDFHLYGYNQARLRETLETCGFEDIEFKEPQDYHKDLEPCMRAEARKRS